MRAASRCACGEVLRPGDRAGRISATGELLCLRCLADVRAGRPRRRTRRSSRPAPARTRKPRRWTGLIVAAVVVLLAMGAVYVRSAVVNGSGSSAVSGGSSRDIHTVWPPVPTDARANPLGAPPPKESSSTEYSFIRTVDGPDGVRPVAWDPCRPIHLVVNDAKAPTGSDKLLQEATAQITAATGLRFIVDGPTTETPSADRAPENKDLYGDTWSPVLVSWTDPATVPQLKGTVAGLAGPDGAPYYEPDQEHWVSGSVNLDGPQLATELRSPGGWAAARAIVMHEFGHLVGLKHVPERTELMYGETTGRTTFGPGDLEGLRQLGLGPCFSS